MSTADSITAGHPGEWTRVIRPRRGLVRLDLFVDVDGFEVHALRSAEGVLTSGPDCYVEVHESLLPRYGVSAMDSRRYAEEKFLRLMGFVVAWLITRRTRSRLLALCCNRRCTQTRDGVWTRSTRDPYMSPETLCPTYLSV